MGLIPSGYQQQQQRQADVLVTSVTGGPPLLLPRESPLSPNLPADVDTRQREIVHACIIAPLFTIVFVLARLYSRRFITRRLQIDDWIALGTLVLCIVYSVLLSLWTTHGGGMHMDDLVQLHMLDSYYKWLLISSPSYLLALIGYKANILILYLRLFTLQRKTIAVTWLVLIVTVAYLGCNFITQIFGCQPISKFFDKYDQEAGHCIDFVTADIAYGSLNVITDLAIFLLPLPALWLSGLARREKLGCTVVFLTGVLAFAVALVRFQFAARDLTAVDRTFLAGDTMLWMVLEINTGLIVSCTPALKPLYRRWFASERQVRFSNDPAPPDARRELRAFEKPRHGPLSMPTIDEDEREYSRRSSGGSSSSSNNNSGTSTGGGGDVDVEQALDASEKPAVPTLWITRHSPRMNGPAKQQNKEEEKEGEEEEEEEKTPSPQSMRSRGSSFTLVGEDDDDEAKTAGLAKKHGRKGSLTSESSFVTASSSSDSPKSGARRGSDASTLASRRHSDA